MRIYNIDLGDFGHGFDLDIEASDIENCSSSDLLDLFSTLESKEKDTFTERFFYEEIKTANAFKTLVSKSEIAENIIRNILNELMADEAHKIVSNLSKDFVSLAEIQNRLKSINEG